MLKQVYTPFYTILNVLEDDLDFKKDGESNIDGVAKLLKETLRFPPVELAVYSSSSELRKLIYILVVLLVYQGDQAEYGWKSEMDDILKYFKENGNIKVPSEYLNNYKPENMVIDQDPTESDTVFKNKELTNRSHYDASILTIPKGGLSGFFGRLGIGSNFKKGGLLFFGNAKVGLNEEPESNSEHYNIVEDCLHNLYTYPGDFAFQHLLPLIAIVKAWRSHSMSTLIFPISRELRTQFPHIYNRNTLEPVIGKVDKIRVRGMENSLERFVTFETYNDTHPRIHNALKFLETKVFEKNKINKKKMTEFNERFIDASNSSNEKLRGPHDIEKHETELGILFKQLHKLNYGDYMVPNSRNVIQYTSSQGSPITRLCFEYEKDDLVKLRRVIDTTTWEEMDTYGNFVKNITEFWSRIITGKMVLAQILIYYLNKSKDESPSAMYTEGAYVDLFLDKNEDKLILKTGCPGVFVDENKGKTDKTDKYRFGVVEKHYNKDDTYDVLLLKNHNEIGYNETIMKGGYVETQKYRASNKNVKDLLDSGEKLKLVTPHVYFDKFKKTNKRFKAHSAGVKEDEMYNEYVKVKKKSANNNNDAKKGEVITYPFYDPGNFPLDDPFRYMFPSIDIREIQRERYVDKNKKEGDTFTYMGETLNIIIK